jgi:superoxide reductase
MALKKPNTQEAAGEKHVPIIEKSETGLMVKIGQAPHPMEAGHYIEWIEATLKNGQVVNKYLKPGDPPEFKVCDCQGDTCHCGEIASARAYCNVHGLWSV